MNQKGWMTIAPHGKTWGPCFSTRKGAIYATIYDTGNRDFVNCANSEQWAELVAQGWRVAMVTITEGRE